MQSIGIQKKIEQSNKWNYNLEELTKLKLPNIVNSRDYDSYKEKWIVGSNWN